MAGAGTCVWTQVGGCWELRHDKKRIASHKAPSSPIAANSYSACATATTLRIYRDGIHQAVADMEHLFPPGPASVGRGVALPSISCTMTCTPRRARKGTRKQVILFCNSTMHSSHDGPTSTLGADQGRPPCHADRVRLPWATQHPLHPLQNEAGHPRTDPSPTPLTWLYQRTIYPLLAAQISLVVNVLCRAITMQRTSMACTCLVVWCAGV